MKNKVELGDEVKKFELKDCSSTWDEKEFKLNNKIITEMIRDELSAEYVKEHDGIFTRCNDWEEQSTIFKSGFNAAIEIMEKREKVLREALVRLIEVTEKYHPMPSYSESISIARQALKELESE